MPVKIFEQPTHIFPELALQTYTPVVVPVVKERVPVLIDRSQAKKNIMEGVYSLEITTSDQLRKMHYSESSLDHVRRHIKPLVGKEVEPGKTAPGYVDILNRYTRASTDPMVYGVGSLGWQWLKDKGKPIETRWRSKNGMLPKGYHLEHHLGINEFLISAWRLPKFVPHRLVLQKWLHQHDFESEPLVVPGVKNFKGDPYELKPDGMVDFKFHDPLKRVVAFLELNLTEMDKLKWQKKVESYILAAPVIEERFGTLTYTVSVFVQSDFHFYPAHTLDSEHPLEIFGVRDRQKRLTQFVEWTEEVQERLEKKYNRDFEMFLFTDTPIHTLSPQQLFTEPRMIMPFHEQPESLIVPPEGGEID